MDGATDAGPGDSGADGADDAGADDAGADDAGADAAADVGLDACEPPPCPAPPDGCSYVTTDPCVCGDLVCDGTECTEDSECPGGFCRATMVDGATPT